MNGREFTQKRLVTLWNLMQARATAHTMLGAAVLHGGGGCSGGVSGGGLQCRRDARAATEGQVLARPASLEMCTFAVQWRGSSVE